MNLQQREKAFEDKFAHDEELHFKVRAKRNKMAGLWAAEKISKNPTEYANQLVSALLNREQLYKKLETDFGAANVEVSENELKAKIIELVNQSRAEILGKTE